MDEKIYFLKDKKTGKVVGIRFREKTYDVTDETSTEVYKEIKKDYSDFYTAFETIKNNNGFVTEYVKPTKTLSLLNKNGLKTRLKAGIATVILTAGLGAIVGCEKAGESDKTAIVETDDDISLILNQLDEGIQKDSWTKINNFQNYFNNTASEGFAIEEDEDARIHLSAEQCIALFVKINAERISPEDMAYIFGSNSSWFNFANMDDKFTEASRILNYYYLSATNRSGLNILFADDTDSKIFSDFENLVLDYNNNRTDENKEAINNSLDNIFLNSSLEDPKTTNIGAASAIGSGIVPILHATKVIDEEKLNNLVEINETITCNKLNKYVKESTSTEVEQNGKRIATILETLPEKLDKNNIKNNNLNINFEARYNKIIAELYGKDYAYSNGIIENNNVEYTVSNGSVGNISREEAVSIYGEAAVEQSEAKAKEEFENTYGEENKKEEAYGLGLTAIANTSLYDNSYNYVSQNGNKPDISNFSSIINETKNNYSGSYKTSYDNGVDTGAINIINNAYNDAIIEYNARQESSTKITVEEEYISEEELPVVIEETKEDVVSLETPVEVTPQVIIEEPVEEIIVEEEYIEETMLEETTGPVRVRE